DWAAAGGGEEVHQVADEGAFEGGGHCFAGEDDLGPVDGGGGVAEGEDDVGEEAGGGVGGDVGDRVVVAGDEVEAGVVLAADAFGVGEWRDLRADEVADQFSAGARVGGFVEAADVR